MKIVILGTVYAPSPLGDQPAFEGDVLDVDSEAGTQLIDAGSAVSAEEQAVPAEEPAADEEKGASASGRRGKKSE